jgi:Spy/CpxP family protein refolding chaperone
MEGAVFQARLVIGKTVLLVTGGAGSSSDWGMKTHRLIPQGSRLLVAILGLASVWPGGAFSQENAGSAPAAQKRGRPDGAGPGAPGKGFRDGTAQGMPSPEERLKMMSEKLGLSAEQQGKVRAILEKSGPELKALMEKGRENATDADKEKFRSVMRGQMEEIAGVLNPEQREKFKEAMKARAGERGGGSPGGASGSDAGSTGAAGVGKMEERLAAMKEKLGLSAEQEQKVRAIFEKNSAKIREAFSAGGEKVREAMRAQMEEVADLLSPEQREKMRDLAPKRESSGQRPSGKPQ